MKAGIGQKNDEYNLQFILEYKNKSPLQILLIDEIRDIVLRQSTIDYNEVLDRNQSLNVKAYVQNGIQIFRIVVVNTKTQSKRELLFTVDDDGKVTHR
jgi:hypothetical protein